MTNLEQEYTKETGEKVLRLILKPEAPNNQRAIGSDYVLWLESLVSKTVSDEIVMAQARLYDRYSLAMETAFEQGAKWMREKLKGTQR
jgi:hypothetical protein